MAIEIGTAFISIVPSFRGLQDNIERELRGVNTRRAGENAGDDYSTGFGGAAKKIGATLAAAFATDKVVGFLKESVGQASDLYEAASKMQVVFGSANATVQQFASQGAKALGLSSLEAQNAAANFGVFGKSAGLASEDNAKFSDGMAQLAVDMASFSNTTPADAIEALSAGLRGETEPLRRYGVLLDDASMRTEAMSMGIISTTKDALTPQQKVLAAHSLILKQTTDAQGDFQRTSGGLANQQRILSAQWIDMKGSLGAAFLPAVTAVVSGLNGQLLPAITSLVPKVKSAWSVLMMTSGDFSSASAAIGGPESPLVQALLFAHDTALSVNNDLYDAWQLLTTGKFIAGSFGGFAEDSPLVKFIFTLRETGLDSFSRLSGIWNTLWATAKDLWPSVQSIASSLAEASASVGISVWGLFLTLAESLAGILQTTLVPAMNTLAGLMRDNQGVVTALVGAYTAYRILTLGAALATGVWTAATTLASGAHLIFGTQMIATNIAVAWGIAAYYASAIATGVLTAATWLLNTAIAVLTSPITLVVVAIAALAAGVMYAYNNFEWFRNGVQFVWDIVQNVITAAWAVIQTVFSAIWGAIQGTIDFFQNFSDRVSTVWTNITGWISVGFTTVVQWFMDLPGNIWGAVQALWSNVITWGQQLLAWILAGVGVGAVAVWNWFLALPSNLWGYISTAWSAAVGWGTQLITWVKDGIVAGAVNIWNWFLALPGALWNIIGGWVGTATGWGSSLIGWVKDGIVNGASGIWAWFTQLPSVIGDFFSRMANSAIEWGKGVVGKIADGISGAKDVIVKAFTDLFSISFSVGGSSAKIGVGGIEITTGNATGGVIPGTDPGRRDNVLTPMRSGEAVMVPEWTRAVGGASTVHAMNRAAESGSLDLSAFGPGYAAGGVVGEDKGPYGLGVKTAKLAFDKISEWAKGLFDAKAAASISGGINTSQDPNTFGWKQASGIVPYSWNGNPIVGGVAGGTEGLWGALLNELVPGIPGGLTGPMWGFEDRPNVNSPSSPSFHAFGLATDINAEQNPNGAPGDGRSGNGVIPAGLARSVAAKLGMLWGGDFTGTPDPMHFEIHVSPGQIHGGSVTLADTGRASGGGGSFVASAGVDQWAGTVNQALSILGMAPGFAGYILHQMDTESSGNPAAINNWDSNARAGIPSKGLMQVIDPTFRSYAMAPYNQNIYDPLSNIIASIRYVMATYGSIPAGMRGVAYDNGGWLQPGGMGRNFLKKPEAVLTPDQSKAYQTHAESLAAGYGGSVQSSGITFSGDIHLGQGSPQDLFDEALWRARAMVGR